MSEWQQAQLERQARFWAQVRLGATFTAACEAAGVERHQGYRWRKMAGGRIPPVPRIGCGRCLSLPERLQIADLRLAGKGVRAIALELGRAPSTISRELARNRPPQRAQAAVSDLREDHGRTPITCIPVQHTRPARGGDQGAAQTKLRTRWTVLIGHSRIARHRQPPPSNEYQQEQADARPGCDGEAATVRRAVGSLGVNPTMSKLAAQRAMREAKYARNSASGPSRREAAAVEGTSTAPATGTPSTNPAQAGKAAPTAAAPEGERCGHKSMNGRACTREAAHTEKSHRYS